MANAPQDIEIARRHYQPNRIATLFVGESAPAGGPFFYYANSGLYYHMKRAVEDALGHHGAFLDRFQAYGWYLDDLVLTPVNHLRGADRMAKWHHAQTSLADRVRRYRPHAIVSLLLGIREVVHDAASQADYTGPLHAVPFPARHQARFRSEFARILPHLPRLDVTGNLVRRR